MISKIDRRTGANECTHHLFGPDCSRPMECRIAIQILRI